MPGSSTDNQANTRSRRPLNPLYEQININFSDDNSRYDSLQVSVNKRMSYGLTLMGNYTFSRSTQQRGARMLWD
ncbi:MAG TPA: hypothetical protein VEQ63_05505 [Bryobacteraceae bacterium]|nr:hypothetical protein [Bryobacteraceae bacterium]